MAGNADRVAAIVVTHEGRARLAACLESLLLERSAGLDILVVDNGSRDGTADWTRARYPRVRVVQLPSNLGFAGGANAGIERALGDGARWIFLLNDDAAVRRGLFERLLDAARAHPEGCAFGPRIVFQDRPSVIASAGIRILRDGGARDIMRGEPIERGDGPAREVFGVSAAAALFRRSLFDDAGLFEPRFFAYFEDVDLAWRARHLGRRAYYVPEAVATHSFAATRGAASLRRLLWLQRNRLRVVVRDIPGVWRALGAALRASAGFLPLPGAIGRAKRSSPFFRAHGKARQLAVYTAGWTAAAADLPRLVTERRRIQRASLLTSEEVEWWLSNDFGPPRGRDG